MPGYLNKTFQIGSRVQAGQSTIIGWLLDPAIQDMRHPMADLSKNFPVMWENGVSMWVPMEELRHPED